MPGYTTPRHTKLITILCLAAAAASTAATAGAQNATAFNKPFSIGGMGGASVPLGDLSNGANTGYNLTGILGLNTPDLPVNFRLNLGYNNFGLKGAGTGSNVRVWEFSGNGTYTFPVPGPSIKPYLTGGLGMYNTGGSINGISTGSANHFGFNAGGGLIIPLSGFNAFVEARYHQVNQDNGASLKYVPITFGIMF